MDFLRDATEILCEGANDSYRQVHVILEDAESPLTRKSIETLYQDVIDKGHVDFDTIPKSRGDIRKYSGYETMVSVLADIQNVVLDGPTYKDLAAYQQTVSTAVNNLVVFAPYYMRAFNAKQEMIILEYNTFVYTCVEATTALLYQFVDFIKTPSSDVLKAAFKNTKYRADLFYMEQLQKFNEICKSGKYKVYLESMINKGTENLLADGMVVGTIAIASVVLLSIIPVTRRLIYTFQDMRGRIAEDLEMQAYFLELNKATVEANTTRDPKKNKKILENQEKLRLKFLRLAEKLRVKSVRAEELAQKNIENENKGISIDTMREKTDNDDFSIL